MIRIFLNSLTRLTGLALLAFSVYYGTSHDPGVVHGGFVHIPSFIFVSVGLVGIVMASYRAEIIWKVFWNVIGFSPSMIRKRFLRMEKILPDLTQIYYQEGGSAFLEEVENRKLSSLWQFIATQLESKVPLQDIQLLIQNRGKLYNESLMTQIRFLQGLATVAPAVGMTGTILGLIMLLKDLHNFETLGSNMALAFITALYGLIYGNFVFIPMVNRLNAAREEANRLVSQALFWLEMVSSRKPATYMESHRDLRIKTN